MLQLQHPNGYRPDDTADVKRDISYFRKVLGEFTVRESVEAVYGEKYATFALGEDGGKDILVSELNANDDIREANGLNRTDVGENRLPQKTIQSSADRKLALEMLHAMTGTYNEAIENSARAIISEDIKDYVGKNVADDIDNMLPEDRDEVLRIIAAIKQDN